MRCQTKAQANDKRRGKFDKMQIPITKSSWNCNQLNSLDHKNFNRSIFYNRKWNSTKIQSNKLSSKCATREKALCIKMKCIFHVDRSTEYLLTVLFVAGTIWARGMLSRYQDRWSWSFYFRYCRLCCCMYILFASYY